MRTHPFLISSVLSLFLLTACVTTDSPVAAVDAHPDWTPEVKQAVSAKKVITGMTKEQVLAAWGEPARRNTSGGKIGVSEQWVYDMAAGAAVYLYFGPDGTVHSWQQDT